MVNMMRQPRHRLRCNSYIINRFICDKAPKDTRIIYKEFANKTMVVTGASSGIGKGIAERLNEQNTKVIAVARRGEKLKNLNINNLVPIVADLSDPRNIDAVKQDILKENPEFLINSAGTSIAVNGRDTFLNLDYEGLREVFSLNFDGVFRLSQQICKHWRDEEIPGRVANISSAASISTIKEHLAYTTSKYALDGLTKTMALELGEYNIRVNSVHPTVTLTEMARKVWFEKDGKTPTPAAQELLKQIPFGRFIEVDEVVDLVFYLLSDSAMIITGQRISIDGGLTC